MNTHTLNVKYQAWAWVDHILWKGRSRLGHRRAGFSCKAPENDSEFAYVTYLGFLSCKKKKKEEVKSPVKHNNQKVETTHMSIKG